MTASSRPFRILLIDPVYGRHTPFWFAPLSLGYIAAMLSRHFGPACEIEIERERDRVLSCLRSKHYDIVAATNYVWNSRLSNKYLSLAKMLHPEVVTIQGGPHFQNTEPEVGAAYLRDNSSVDYYVHGESEATMVVLVERLMAGRRLDAEEPGVAFLRDDQYLDGGRRVRMRDLDVIPSPYLEGWLDRFIGNGFAPLIETNRGCPFSCTFCNWGSATVSKVNRFSLDRVHAELEYIAHHVRDNDSLTVADANFGILKRDLEIAEKIEELWQSRGFPGHILLWNTKNASERSIEIGRILGGKLRVLLAVQSLNEEVLKNVKRGNIKLSTYEELAAHARANDLWTQSDLIVGLPGEDLSSLKKNLEVLYERGTDKVDLNSLMPIPGTEVYSKKTRERFGMKTMHRLADGCAMDVEGEFVAETEEVVVETNTMSFRDFVTSIQYSALTIFWHHCGVGEPASNYARGKGIVEPRLLFGMLESSENRPDTARALDFLEQQIRAGLHSTPSGVQQAAERRRSEGPRGTHAEWNFVHHLIKEGSAGSMIDDIFDTLERLLFEQSGIEPNGELRSLRAFTKAYQKTVDTGATTRVSVEYDPYLWMQENYRGDFERFRTDGTRRLTLRRVPERLPKADLASIDASTCSADQFNHWFYFIRSTRNYVAASA